MLLHVFVLYQFMVIYYITIPFVIVFIVRFIIGFSIIIIIIFILSTISKP